MSYKINQQKLEDFLAKSESSEEDKQAFREQAKFITENRDMKVWQLQIKGIVKDLLVHFGILEEVNLN